MNRRMSDKPTDGTVVVLYPIESAITVATYASEKVVFSNYDNDLVRTIPWDDLNCSHWHYLDETIKVEWEEEGSQHALNLPRHTIRVQFVGGMGDHQYEIMNDEGIVVNDIKRSQVEGFENCKAASVEYYNKIIANLPEAEPLAASQGDPLNNTTEG